MELRDHKVISGLLWVLITSGQFGGQGEGWGEDDQILLENRIKQWQKRMWAAGQRYTADT